MITYSAAGYLFDWTDHMYGSTPRNSASGEYFPAMEEAVLAEEAARTEARRNRFRSSWKAVAGAPRFVINQAGRLVPASIKAALNERAEAKALEIGYRRLEEISPHLLADIGIEQMARGVYAVIEADETLVDVCKPEPVVAVIQPKRAVPAAKPASKPVRRPSARTAPAPLAGAFSM